MTIEEAIDYLSEGYCDTKPTDDKDTIELKHKHNDAYEIAIEALEKQMPKDVFETYDDDTCLYKHFECLSCGDRLSRHTNNSYCMKCGQLIKWEIEF